MAKKKGSTPPSNRGFSSEEIEQLENFYSLPIDEQTAHLAHDPQLAANNILRHEGTLGRAGKPTRSEKTAPAAELSRLHRLTQDEADLVLDFRLMSPEAQEAVRLLVQAQASNAEPYAGNVVSLRPA